MICLYLPKVLPVQWLVYSPFWISSNRCRVLPSTYKRQASFIPAEDLELIETKTGLKPAKLPVRYLGGFPLTSKKLSMSDCQPFIERVRGKQQAWTVKHLSYAGRVQLLKSVIAGLINFRSSVFILPKKCIKMVDLIDFVRLSSGRALHCLQLAHVSLGLIVFVENEKS